MKKLILAALLMVSVVAVNANEKKEARKQKKAEKEAHLVEQTKKSVEAKTWHFNATQMLPSSGKSRSITNYSVVIKDGNMDSYLPYFGRAYSAGYGGTDSPMTFEAPIKDYSVSDAKKGGYMIKFKAKNKNDLLEYTFNVSANGSATLSVNSTNRPHITYYGDLIPYKESE